VSPAGYCVIVDRQRLGSSYRKKIEGSPFFLFPLARDLRHRALLRTLRRTPSMLRNVTNERKRMRGKEQTEQERTGEGRRGQERQKVTEEKKGGRTKIATVYHHQVDICVPSRVSLFLPILRSRSRPLIAANLQLHFFFVSFVFFRLLMLRDPLADPLAGIAKPIKPVASHRADLSMCIFVFPFSPPLSFSLALIVIPSGAFES